MPGISFVTTCKGRLDHLRQTLPRMAAQPNTESIVVDYDCPDGTADWVHANYPAVKIVKVHDAPRFHKTHAGNLGVAAATAPWLCMIDADIIVDQAFVSRITPSLGGGTYLRPAPLDWNAYGSFVCSRKDFEAIEGYDEVIEGCGCSDDDIYRRLEMTGIKLTNFPGELFVGIPHDDGTRTQYHEIKNRPFSQTINAVYVNIKHDLLRHSGVRTIPLAIRRTIYAEVRKMLLNQAEGPQSGGRIEVSLPAGSSVPMYRGWELRRKWTFDLLKTRL